MNDRSSTDSTPSASLPSDDAPPTWRSQDSEINELDQLDTYVPPWSETEQANTGASDAFSFSKPTDWFGKTVGSAGRYKIRKLIGRGGMGRVYLAADRNRSEASVAIKVPCEELLAMPGVKERFEREFQALIQLEHPHICRVFDTGRLGDVPFVVLQYFSGGNLQDRCLRAVPGSPTRSVPEGFKWLRPIADALDVMHSRGFLHRDVKPENILFDEHGHVCLGDFGIVRVLDEASRSEPALTGRGECIGTPGYIAPELLEGQHKTADGRADLYALAAVAYLYLTGHPPFAGDTDDMVRVAQLTGQSRRARDVNPAVPEAASDVLARGLSLKSHDRPATCRVFVDELAAAYGVTATGASGFIETGNLRKQPRRWRRFVIVTTTLAGLAAGVPYIPGFPDRVHEEIVRLIERLFPSPHPPSVRPPGPFPPLTPEPPPTPENETVSITPDTKYENAIRYLDGGENLAVIQEINSLPAEDMEARHYVVRGQAFFALRQDDEAVTDLDKAIQLDPQADYFSVLGRMWLLRGDTDKAASLLKQAISRNPEEPRYHAQLGAIHMQLNAYDQAVTDFDNAINRATEQNTSRELANWYNGRGAARLKLSTDQQSLELALKDASHAIHEEPGEPDHYRNRARVLSRLGRHEESDKDNSTATQLEQNS